MPEVRVGIDVGGTFTDTAMIGADGRLRISKVPSTPADLSAGFVRGLDVLLQREGIAPADVSFLAHGTTVATNAIVQRRLARSALLTTHGFRDILEIGSQQRPRLYDLWQPKQQAVIAHDDCYGIRERIGPEGDEIEPLHRMTSVPPRHGSATTDGSRRSRSCCSSRFSILPTSCASARSWRRSCRDCR